MSENGFVLLMEAIMEQAYKDAESDNETLKAEAEAYINKMRNAFA